MFTEQITGRHVECRCGALKIDYINDLNKRVEHLYFKNKGAALFLLFIIPFQGGSIPGGMTFFVALELNYLCKKID